MARRDPLTDLPNRLVIDEAFKRLLAQSRTAESTFCLALTDLDAFKQINDTAGHAVGDRVLEGVGNALANSLRPTDVVGRLGGDEFLILLPQADRDGARIAMNRAVAGLPRMQINGEKQSISISVGIAAYPEDGQTFDALYQAADERLYQAKGVSGRSAVMAEAG